MLSTCVLSACSAAPPGAFDAPTRSAALVEGPPVEDIVTAYDRALSCLQGHIDPAVTFGVGQVLDSTGKETYSDGGTGKFVSQGAGEVVQSALFRAGVTVVNRRDPNVVLSETNWGVRNVETFAPSTFYLSGSVNSLDFIPGGGASAQINGVGPRYRQNRILIGLDLALTDSHSGIVVANVALQKQVYAREVGFAADRFFGTDLIGAEIGGMEREALHFALRQMLNLATLELLGAVAGAAALADCRAELDEVEGDATGADTRRVNARLSEVIADARSRATAPEPAPEPVAPDAGTPSEPMTREALVLGREATALAARAISAVEASMNATDAAVAQDRAAEAAQLIQLAIEALRAGAAEGLTGTEGDAAGLLVEQALDAVQQAAGRAQSLADAPAAPTPEDAAPAETGTTAEDNRPGTPAYQRRQGD